MQKYTLKEHFNELKKRFIRVILAFFIGFGISYYYSDDIYKIILHPLISVVDSASRKIIYTSLAEAFFSYIKISFFSALVIVFPLFVYQIYAFMKPGLHQGERKILAFILFSSPVLFYSGCIFMFYFVMPSAWSFFLSYEKVSIGVPLVLEAKISEYLDLVVHLSVAFGLSFQLPVFMAILSLMGVVNSSWLRNKRRLAIVIIFIVAAILTPPDVLSQIALAIPLLLLYELSIILCKLLEKREL
ncbi:MAG: twin-arginine translocase subunit TatC [Rickettsiales bacterium]|uniref:twin-arginine translocase subunit TatC n=1 Tax=Accumulibacter sp. TaxID=2053492 RepID=UPI001ACD630C|nr:twin-arginine translocase subunit TatC [Accumulibacter sp.]MBN8438844.1 twin-arginine translocase subunit TatC [Accumulibacter sp.]MBN8512262.1 twin-arginine translocase subunit TatC [Rickettsiales bacterium]MCA0254288.1 twin-arginine translocase subunit TatC [Pseudomonadota bacterium]